MCDDDDSESEYELPEIPEYNYYRIRTHFKEYFKSIKEQLSKGGTIIVEEGKLEQCTSLKFYREGINMKNGIYFIGKDISYLYTDDELDDLKILLKVYNTERRSILSQIKYFSKSLLT